MSLTLMFAMWIALATRHIPLGKHQARQPEEPVGRCQICHTSKLGARLRGRTATQRSKKGSEKVLGRLLEKGSQKGSEKGACYGFTAKKGSEKGFSEGVLRRGFSRRCPERPLVE